MIRGLIVYFRDLSRTTWLHSIIETGGNEDELGRSIRGWKHIPGKGEQATTN